MATQDQSRMPVDTMPTKRQTGARRPRRRTLVAFGFIVPAFAFVAALLIYPTIYAVYLSFTNLSLFTPFTDWVGVSNYTSFWSDSEAIGALRNTYVYVIVVVLFQFLLGLGFALLLNSIRRGRGLYGAILFMPWVFSDILAVAAWRWIFNGSFGLANYYLGLVNLPQPAWLSSPSLAMATAIALNIWKGYPFSMVLELAGLQTIPADVYESARIDGAGAWQQFLFITLPLLRFTITANLLLITLYTFNIFGLVYALTGGGPVDATEILGLYMYKQAFTVGAVGYGSAVAVIMFALNLIAVLAYFVVLGRRQGLLDQGAA